MKSVRCHGKSVRFACWEVIFSLELSSLVRSKVSYRQVKIGVTMKKHAILFCFCNVILVFDWLARVGCKMYQSVSKTLGI